MTSEEKTVTLTKRDFIREIVQRDNFRKTAISIGTVYGECMKRLKNNLPERMIGFNTHNLLSRVWALDFYRFMSIHERRYFLKLCGELTEKEHAKAEFSSTVRQYGLTADNFKKELTLPQVSEHREEHGKAKK